MNARWLVKWHHMTSQSVKTLSSCRAILWLSNESKEFISAWLNRRSPGYEFNPSKPPPPPSRPFLCIKFGVWVGLYLWGIVYVVRPHDVQHDRLNYRVVLCQWMTKEWFHYCTSSIRNSCRLRSKLGIKVLLFLSFSCQIPIHQGYPTDLISINICSKGL